MTENGLICSKCNKCDIARIIDHAEANNFKVFIVPGGSIVKNIIKTHKIDLSKDKIIGVACENEINIFRKDLFAMKPNEILHKAVELVESGCMNTKVDLDELFAVIDSFGID